MSSLLPRLLVLAVLVTAARGDARAAEADGFKKEAWAFFDQHCFDCHEKGTAKGGLDLEAADAAMAGTEQVELWTRVFDRVAKGEMPPPKKPQPQPAEVARLLGLLQPRLVERDRATREVVQRRLNREEYQNTIRDLLAIDVELKQLLPEDQQRGGFDNNGEGLSLSTEQMQGYLAAAQAAIEAAIVTRERPKTETFQVDSLAEVQRYIDEGQFGFVDGRVVTYLTNETSYSKLSTRARRVPVRGRYRFRFEAAAVGTEEPLVFSVTASDFASVSAAYRTLGYYEVGATPQTFEIEALMEAKSAIQFFAHGLPTYLKKPMTGQAGIGFGPVEITGPLLDQWPPESHTRLLGGVDLKAGTIADAEAILRRLLPRAFRRPVEAGEVQRFLALVRARLEAGRGFEESLKVGFTAVLCSPNFLYLRETARPIATRISDHELASRLSYFLWSSMPDAALLALADRGKLREPRVLAAEVERLLQSPRSEAFVGNFTGQWLRLRQINDTTPDAKLYKKFDELLQVSMVREGEGFFRELLARDLSIANFLDSDFAMLNGRLARHYGIDGVRGFALRPVPLPPGSVRGGVLTQAGVLKVTANGTNTSPVMRGVWVLENILGEPTPPPPPNTGGIEPDIRGATTIRQQLEKHRDVESCNVCHRHIDPPGFALESFDPIGDFRANYLRFVVSNPEKGWGSVQPGAVVDASGKLATGEPFAEIRAFKKLLVERRAAFARCLTEKLLSYGLGREMGFADRDAVTAIVRQFEAQGNGLRTLVHAIVESETFATR